MRPPPRMVGEHLDRHSGWINLPQMRGKLNFLVHAIVVMHKSADKTDHNSGLRGPKLRRNVRQQKKHDAQRRHDTNKAHRERAGV